MTFSFAGDDAHILSLVPYRSCIIEPMRQEGKVAGGKLFAADPYDRHTPYVLARILYAHPACTDARVGAVVVTQAHAFERTRHHCEAAQGWFEFFIMHENNAEAEIEGYDQALLQYSQAEPRREADDEHPFERELVQQSA